MWGVRCLVGEAEGRLGVMYGQVMRILWSGEKVKDWGAYGSDGESVQGVFIAPCRVPSPRSVCWGAYHSHSARPIVLIAAIGKRRVRVRVRVSQGDGYDCFCPSSILSLSAYLPSLLPYPVSHTSYLFFLLLYLLFFLSSLFHLSVLVLSL